MSASDTPPGRGGAGRYVLTTLLALVPFLVLMVVVVAHDGHPLGADLRWADLVRAGAGTVYRATMVAVSALGGGLLGGVVVPAVLAVVVQRLAGTRAAQAFVTVEIVSFLLVQAVKNVVGRPRPPETSMTTLFASFPSGHTANAATMTVLLVLLLRRRWLVVVSVAWTTLMALSRTALADHWLSDTVAGASLGLAVALVARPLLARARRAPEPADGPVDGRAGGPVPPAGQPNSS